MANIVALLDSMWGWGGFNKSGEEAPRYYRINSSNHSGNRLYRLCGDHRLLVTNCCRYIQAHANSHGKPDLDWTEENLRFLRKEKMDLLLVCGRVAKETWTQVFKRSSTSIMEFSMIPTLFIDHPAARRWSNAKLDSTTREIDILCRASTDN